MRLPVALPLLLLGVAIGSRDAAPDSLASEPCSEIANYLSDFSARHPELASDTGRAEFLAAAINWSPEPAKSKGLAIEALQPVEFGNAFEAIRSLREPIAEPSLEQRLQTGELSARYLYDVRSLGGFAVLSDSQGTMQCSSGFVLESEQDELHLGPVLENEGGQICWDRTFEVIKVHGRAFPAVISRDVYFRSLAYNIALLPIDGNIMNIDHPLCTVSVNYSPTFEVAEWFRAPELSDTTDQELRSKLEPILTTLAAGTYQQPSSGDEGTLTDQFLQEYDRHGSAVSHIVPFARMPANPYSQLAGPLSPITLGGKNYMLGFGDAQFGWRTWIDFAFGLWVTDGAELRPIVGGFMGKRGAHLEISVESGQR